jgi:hypothetical protein
MRSPPNSAAALHQGPAQLNRVIGRRREGHRHRQLRVGLGRTELWTLIQMIFNTFRIPLKVRAVLPKFDSVADAGGDPVSQGAQSEEPPEDEPGDRPYTFDEAKKGEWLGR